ncbi:MAG: hypothetical protein N2749_03985 [Clostridia bacterium]|nr:hypothetical protein [Clostridia bacterium]
MLLFSAFFICFTVIDIITLIKRKDRKNLMVFIGLSLVAIAFAIFYYSDMHRDSLVEVIFKLFNIEE